jgi:integral membrane protein
MHDTSTPPPALRAFRAVAFAEGVSFLALLGVAMPLKYALGLPLAVTIVGGLHGLLFLAYLALAIPLFTELGWSLARAPGVLAAAVLPFGTFVLERAWLR